MKKSNAKIHSIQTMGLVDGPGIRYVVFFQGCPLRCIYCHNPDTWNGGCPKSRGVTLDYLVEDALKYTSYFKSSGGGVTASGGEPLVQKQFVLEFFKELKKHDIHTTLDTSGFTTLDHTTKELLYYTDLVIIDIKASPDSYQSITGQSIDKTLEFARYLTEKKIPIWIKFVLIPGVNDNKNELAEIGKLVSELKPEKLDVLPFHQLGSPKWKDLDYKLRDHPPATQTQADNAKKIILAQRLSS